MPLLPAVPEVALAIYEAVKAYDEVIFDNIFDPVKLPLLSVKIARLLPLIYTSSQAEPSADL